ncbi:MAG: phosphoglycolate phosphatase [Rhodobacteraceae bacterium HLUCCA12]|nr:MAG: phosphoglycolate phosphatase [Rhodobacteraceae bacterium HLUCCA12]
MDHIRAILFDKDGTLFDFQATWGAWAGQMIADLAGADRDLHDALAQTLAYDPLRRRFHAHSMVIAGTSEEVAERIAPLLPDGGGGVAALTARMARAAAHAPLAEAVPLRPLLSQLRNAGYRLGVATNDNESVARQHLAGQSDLFDFICGFDSGHGGKPAPGMLLAFAAECGLAPESVLMVGDSRHDLDAGRAAGMATLAVLTGVATEADLAPHADAVRPDIGHLPGYLRPDASWAPRPAAQ